MMSEAPRWFRAAAIVALLWNLMGCAAYLSDVMLGPEDVAKMTPAQQELYQSRPAWAVSATAIAVWGGALGCIGLFLRKKWAYPVLVLSLLGVIVQDIGLFVLHDGLAAGGAVAVVLQAIVLAVSIWLVVLARKSVRNGWVE